MEFCDMYAIIETGGKQFRVELGMKLQIPEMDAEEGAAVVFDRVLLCSNGEEAVVGTPVVAGAKVNATCLGESQGEKITIFKKKRRKNYKRKTGHRQGYTMVKINEIVSPIAALAVPEEEIPATQDTPAQESVAQDTAPVEQATQE